MTTSDRLNVDELEIRIQKRTSELENINQELRAELHKHKKTEEACGKSEKNYRMLFTNMTEAFFLAEIICDNDGKPYDYRYLELNPAYEFNTGIKKEQILCKSALEVFSNENPVAIENTAK